MLLSLLLGCSCSAETIKLLDALAFAYETNPQLAQSRAQLWEFDQGVDQANAGWRPSVNASLTYGYDRGVVADVSTPLISRPLIGQVTLSQPVFRGGRTYAEVSRAIALDRAGRAQLISTEQSVLLAAVTAYEDVVRDIAHLNIAQDNLHALEIEKNNVHTEFASGAVTRTDVSQADARFERARADEAVAENQLAASHAVFEDVIGRPAETLETDVRAPALPGTKEAALQTALKENPDLVKARFSERAADFAVNDAVGAMLPEVSLLGQYQVIRQAANASVFGLANQQKIASVLAQVNVPIYQGGGEEAAVRKAKDAHAETELALVTAERSVRRNLDSTWQALRSLEITISADRAQSAADQSAVAGMREQQKGGERSVIDVLNAQQELYASQNSLADAQHDLVVSSFRLLSATGHLTAQHLGLRVNLYDPQEHYEENADAWFGLGK